LDLTGDFFEAGYCGLASLTDMVALKEADPAAKVRAYAQR
jgi:hypothetical protein